jgi:hypothetical protein
MSEDQMQRHLLGLAALAMVLGAAGCVNDPTSDLSGTPTRIVASYAKLLMTEGDTVGVTAELHDAQGAPLNLVPVASSATPAVVDVVSQHQATPQPYLQFSVAGVAAGAGLIILSYEGVAPDTITVAVFPVSFDGAVAVKTGGQLDTVTIAAGSVVSFDPATTTVDIEGVPARLLSVTANAITAIARNAGAVAAATVTLNNVLFLAGTADETPIQSIDADATPDIRGEANEPANNDPSTAPVIGVNGPYVEGLISSGDADDFWAFTLAADATVTAQLDFDGDGGSPDIDMYLLGPAPTNDNYCDLDNCDAASGAQPEIASADLAAGTYYVYVNFYAAGSGTEPFYYKLTVTQ